MSTFSFVSRCIVLLFSLQVSSCSCMMGKHNGRPDEMDSATRDSLTRAIESGRKETEEWLRSSPSSYLGAIQRVDFGDQQSITVGSDQENDVRIDDQEIADRHLRVTVQGDSFHVAVVDSGATFSVNGNRLRDAMLPPSAIGIGRFTIRLSHQRFPALILFDPSGPRYREYKGLRYFPVDFRYRFTLPLTLNEKSDTITILSSRGNRRRALRVGWFAFDIEGTACRLEVSRLLEPGVGERSYSVFFRDRTCGEESYPMGRYVEAVEKSDGVFVVDFNTAYNPACAFSPHYNCPVPPAANDLPVRIPAGEMDAHYAAH